MSMMINSSFPVASILVVERKNVTPYKKQDTASTKPNCDDPDSINRIWNIAIIYCIVQPYLSYANTVTFPLSENNLNITLLIDSFAHWFS